MQERRSREREERDKRCESSEVVSSVTKLQKLAGEMASHALSSNKFLLESRSLHILTYLFNKPFHVIE